MPRLIVAVLMLVASGAAAGPYLAIGPGTSPLHLSYDYDYPGTGEQHRPTDTLLGTSVEVGWRVAGYAAVAVERIDTPNTLHGRFHTYDHLVLRFDVYPTGGRWWLGAGLGFAGAHGEALSTPWIEEFIPSGSGFVTLMGCGYEYPLHDHLGVRGRLDLLAMHNLSFDTTDRMNARGVRAGLLLVWRP